jgi:hypothetical protein
MAPPVRDAPEGIADPGRDWPEIVIRHRIVTQLGRLARQGRRNRCDLAVLLVQ